MRAATSTASASSSSRCSPARSPTAPRTRWRSSTSTARSRSRGCRRSSRPCSRSSSGCWRRRRRIASLRRRRRPRRCSTRSMRGWRAGSRDERCGRSRAGRGGPRLDPRGAHPAGVGRGRPEPSAGAAARSRQLREESRLERARAHVRVRRGHSSRARPPRRSGGAASRRSPRARRSSRQPPTGCCVFTRAPSSGRQSSEGFCGTRPTVAYKLAPAFAVRNSMAEVSSGVATPRSRMSQRPHLLIVDDDREIRGLLAQYLEKHDFRTTAVADGKEMRRVMERSHVDLLVLDLMLPGEDGLTLCRELRSRSQVPIIMLTARGEDVDRIVGLELGADDYLPKPFNPRELLGRIKAILRRTAHAPRDPSPESVRGFSFGGWRLATVTRTLKETSGREVALSGAEYRLLAILLAAGNRVLSRAQLTELLRGRDADPFDRSIDVRVSRLRQILGDDARAPQIIKTVYGEGYVVGVAVASD